MDGNRAALAIIFFFYFRLKDAGSLLCDGNPLRANSLPNARSHAVSQSEHFHHGGKSKMIYENTKRVS